MYIKTVQNAKDKQTQVFGEAFLPIFMHTDQEDFKTLVFPSCVKMF